ncbi:MAG TPA: hypothetical protein VNL34_02295 [Candidatus Nitrosotenuis sp.]|nr:hypothetical protein [Candidatus Nitrosotenuis sp.]
MGNLKNLTNGTKINGKKKKKIPYRSKIRDITIDVAATITVSGQPDNRMV